MAMINEYSCFICHEDFKRARRSQRPSNVEKAIKNVCLGAEDYFRQHHRQFHFSNVYIDSDCVMVSFEVFLVPEVLADWLSSQELAILKPDGKPSHERLKLHQAWPKDVKG